MEVIFLTALKLFLSVPVELPFFETYSYEFVFYETTGQIKYAGGDGYIANITDVGKYDDGNT